MAFTYTCFICGVAILISLYVHVPYICPLLIFLLCNDVCEVTVLKVFIHAVFSPCLCYHTFMPQKVCKS